MEKVFESFSEFYKNSINESKVNEDDITPGSKVKCKDSGKMGTVQSWDDESGIYKVAIEGTDDVMDYEDGQLEVIDDIKESKDEVTIDEKKKAICASEDNDYDEESVEDLEDEEIEEIYNGLLKK
jgi:hypothetical protein